MIARWLIRRAVARTAVSALVFGLVVLSILMVLGASGIYSMTSNVRFINDVSACWSSILAKLSTEDTALREFLMTNGNSRSRQALKDIQKSAEKHFVWLEDYGGPVEAHQVGALRIKYDDYTRSVQAALSTSGNVQQLQAYGELAKLIFLPLRDQIIANVERKQKELVGYLSSVNRRTSKLLTLMIIISSIDLFLCSVSIVIIISYQKRSEQEASRSLKASLHDPLTGLANRLLLNQRIEQALTSTQREGPPTGFLLIDLDKFKNINDTLGHHCGDLLLQEIATRISSEVRQDDLAVRLGGDEFAVLLPRIDSIEQLMALAERLKESIFQPIDLEGHIIQMTASIGGSVFPLDCDNAEGLLRHADMAMYVAKRKNHNVHLYEQSHNSVKSS